MRGVLIGCVVRFQVHRLGLITACFVALAKMRGQPVGVKLFVRLRTKARWGERILWPPKCGSGFGRGNRAGTAASRPKIVYVIWLVSQLHDFGADLRYSVACELPPDAEVGRGDEARIVLCRPLDCFFDGQWIALQSHCDAIDRRADLVHLDRFCRHSLAIGEVDDRYRQHKFEFAIGMILLLNPASTKMLARNMRVTEDSWGVIRSLGDGATRFRSLPL